MCASYGLFWRARAFSVGRPGQWDCRSGLCGSVYLPSDRGVVLRCCMISVRWNVFFVRSIVRSIFWNRLSLARVRFASTKLVLDTIDAAYQVHDLLPYLVPSANQLISL